MMKISKGAIATLLLMAPVLEAAAADKALSYEPFPDGYGYMQPLEIAALTLAVKAGNEAIVRQHGWKMWAGIMQPAQQDGTWPIWYTWPNSFGAFVPPPGDDASAKREGAFGGTSLIEINRSLSPSKFKGMTTISDDLPLPYYPVPDAVSKAYPDATKCLDSHGSFVVCDGAHFVSNGDIMVPTESLSQEGFDWIRSPAQPLYQKKTLDDLHNQGVHDVGGIPARYIVTKHMFWPVKAGQISALPVWHDYHPADYPDYAGYETWKDLVAIDPSGKSVGQTVSVSYLYGVFQPDRTMPIPTQTAQAKVHGLGEFYNHQVTQADWDSFDDADKAILNASSYWAYNQPFGPGDYIVTVAMHINTKEIPTWALQSVWWSDQPDEGRYAANRPSMPDAKGPWMHYLMADSYGIPASPGGDQPVAMNPYIELVIHPVATNCNTCHNRAGWPNRDAKIKTSYQNQDCPDLLATLTPKSTCLAPFTLTDFQWIIPDRAN